MYDYDRTKTAGSMWPSVDPNPSHISVWIEMDSYGRVHHVIGDIKQAEKNLDKARDAIVAAQQELGEASIYYNISDIVVTGSKNKGRNVMVVYFHLSPAGNNAFSDVDQGMIMSKFKGVVNSGEKKMPSI